MILPLQEGFDCRKCIVTDRFPLASTNQGGILQKAIQAKYIMTIRYLFAAFCLTVFSFHSALGEVQQSVATVVFGKASPSVVMIRTTTTSGTIQGSGVAFKHGFDDFHRPNITWIVTNAHVVKGNDKVTIENSGKIYTGKVEYSDPDLDVALVTLTNVVIPVVPLYGGDDVPIGERVFAIGSPLGLENSITEGIISGRRKLYGVMVLQTSAPISSGNSGGGLFDASGRLLGITTFKSKSGENVNFAVEAKYALIISDADLAAVLLRIDAEELQALGRLKLSLANIRDIKSPLLTKWLLTKTSDNGELIYKDVQRILNDYLNNKDRAQYDNRRLSVIQQFIAEVPKRNSEHQTYSPATVEKSDGLQRSTQSDLVPALRYDGIYQGRKGEIVTNLRFYPDGMVISVTTRASIDIQKLMGWFNRNSDWFFGKYSSNGKFVRQGRKIFFPIIIYGVGTVDYVGEVQNDVLKLQWTSQINGESGSYVYTFTPVD